MSKKKKKK